MIKHTASRQCLCMTALAWKSIEEQNSQPIKGKQRRYCGWLSEIGSSPHRNVLAEVLSNSREDNDGVQYIPPKVRVARVNEVTSFHKYAQEDLQSEECSEYDVDGSDCPWQLL
eukprot:5699047-Amphidinium_carterae.1